MAATTPRRIPVTRVGQKPVDPRLRALVDYDPDFPTMGGLLGKWSVDILDDTGKSVGGMQAGRDQCVRYAMAEGVSFGRLRYTDRARAYKKWRR